MPRPPRIQAPDVIYHVTSRGAIKRPIFDVLPFDRQRFMALLHETVMRFRWRCHAYCLMGNHFHLVVETPYANVSAGMQFLKGEYARWFNTYHPSREGVLFERRFWCGLTEDESYVRALARYVVLNPVRAGIVASPEQWRWSSYRATVGLEPRPRFLYLDTLLTLFGNGARARLMFAQYVGEGMAGAGRAPLAGEAVSVGLTPVEARRT